MLFASINWVLVLLIVIAIEVFIAINKIKVRLENIKVEKIEVADKIEVKDIKHK